MWKVIWSVLNFPVRPTIRRRAPGPKGQAAKAATLSMTKSRLRRRQSFPPAEEMAEPGPRLDALVGGLTFVGTGQGQRRASLAVDVHGRVSDSRHSQCVGDSRVEPGVEVQVGVGRVDKD